MSAIAEVDLLKPRRRLKRGEPVWDLALLYPPQGEWTEEEYLSLDTNRMIEFVDGFLEVLPMSMPLHQFIVQYLFECLKDFVKSRKLGDVLLAPLPVRLFQGRLREPDVMFFRPGRIPDLRKPPNGADLVIEVVSEGKENRKRDFVTKRSEYAKARIGEYWIVDPEVETILVLRLSGNRYRVHGKFKAGQMVASVLLSGFTVDVNAVFAAATNR